jgi:iron complex transport system permease protein
MGSSTTRNRPDSNSTSSSPARSDRHDYAIVLIGSIAVLLIVAFVALSVGAYRVTSANLAGLFWAKLSGGETSGVADTIIFGIRGPRILAALLVGGALSASGAAYQSLFRNPLVSPDILGVSSGAALGAVLGIYLSLPVIAIEGFAFLGGLAAVAAVYLIATSIRGRDPVLVLVLGGIVVGALLGSGVALLKFMADPYNQLPAITFWLLGSLAAVNRADLGHLVWPVIIALVPLVLLRWRLDVLSLGDEEAAALGVRVGITRIAVIAAATLMTAAAVSISGVVGWIGLLVPHLARLTVGPAFARLLPIAILFGAGFLLIVDTLARTAGTVELPLGALTAVLGTPVFLWLLVFGRRGR